VVDGISDLLTLYEHETVTVWYKENKKHNESPYKLEGPYEWVSNNQISMEVAGRTRILRVKDIINVKPVHDGNNKKREG